jgi:outer membrane protein/protease secretion system outer membrane protein
MALVLSWLLGGLLSLGGALPARAEVPGPTGTATASPTPAPRELTLEQALALGRRANRTLLAEREHLQQAAITVDRAWTALFPTVALQGKYTRNNRAFFFPVAVSPTVSRNLTIQPLDQLDGVASLTTPLVAPAAYPAVRAVKLNEVAASENFQTAVDNVIFGVAQTFHAAAVADEVLAARHSSIAVAQATLDNAKARFSAGTVTKVDVDRAELAVLRAQQAEREAELSRDETYRSLATLIQEPAPFRVRPVTIDAPAPGSTTAGGEQELDLALQVRPEFRAITASVESQRAQQRANALRWAPSLSGFGNLRIFNYDNFAFESHSWALGLQLDWLLFDSGTRDVERRLAASAAAEATARAEVLRDTIRDDLANGRREIETKTRARETSERSVELAKETLELVRVQYEAGTATQVDLLTAQDSLVAAQEALARAHYDIAIADLTLRRASGTLPGR